MASIDQLERLSAANNRQFASTSERTRKAAKEMWLASNGWRDADTARLAKQINPLVQAAMLSVASNESAYLSRYLAVKTGTRTAAGSIARAAVLDVIEDPLERFRQPAIALYAELKRTGLMSVGIDKSLASLDGIIRGALTDSRVAQQAASFKRAKVMRFRRVASLSACDHCLTIIGSGEAQYKSFDLAPLHNKCDCGVAPE